MKPTRPKLPDALASWFDRASGRVAAVPAPHQKLLRRWLNDAALSLVAVGLWLDEADEPPATVGPAMSRAAASTTALAVHCGADPKPEPDRGLRRPLPAGHAAFAELVLKTARDSRTGLFGRYNVFISHIAKALEKDGWDVGVFKTRLVSAFRAGELNLVRADLVEAMPPDDVESSETRYLNAEFHFVDKRGAR